MINPLTWTTEQLEANRLVSRADFARERLEEPLEEYLKAFDLYQGLVERILESTSNLTKIEGSAIDVLGDPKLLEAFRYLAAPPISTDDLKVLADAPSLAKSHLERSPADVERLIKVVRQVLDRRRFAWVVDNREPTEAERNAAVLASATLMAASRVQTQRRTDGKTQQEALVKEALLGLGLLEVPRRRIITFALAPAVGEFCGESVLGSRKADFVVRLWDQRILAIECKVSNSSTNSVKRLNNDAAAKAEAWIRDFGRLQIVPVAVLSGVYNLLNLIDAQSRGLHLVWAHDLAQLTEWIERTKSS